MTSDDAKFILASFRPSTEDADDPQFTEALAVMEGDPELRAWFDGEIALSEALAGKLAEIEVPDGLRADILAGAKVSAVRVRHWPKVLAIAAAVLVAGISIFLWQNRFVPSGPVNMAAYRTDMGAFMDRFVWLDYQSEDLGEVKNWLATNHGFTDYEVPAELAKHPSLGCEVIDWHGKTAYLICFDVDGELVHLFTMPDGVDFEGTPGDAAREFASVNKWSMLSWKEDDNLYLVTTLGDEAHLRKAIGDA